MLLFHQKTRIEYLFVSLLVMGLAPLQDSSQIMEASFPVTDNTETSNFSVAPGEGIGFAISIRLHSHYKPGVVFLTKHIMEKADTA